MKERLICLLIAGIFSLFSVILLPAKGSCADVQPILTQNDLPQGTTFIDDRKNTVESSPYDFDKKGEQLEQRFKIAPVGYTYKEGRLKTNDGKTAFGGQLEGRIILRRPINDVLAQLAQEDHWTKGHGSPLSYVSSIEAPGVVWGRIWQVSGDAPPYFDDQFFAVMLTKDTCLEMQLSGPNKNWQNQQIKNCKDCGIKDCIIVDLVPTLEMTKDILLRLASKITGKAVAEKLSEELFSKLYGDEIGAITDKIKEYEAKIKKQNDVIYEFEKQLEAIDSGKVVALKPAPMPSYGGEEGELQLPATSTAVSIDRNLLLEKINKEKEIRSKLESEKKTNEILFNECLNYGIRGKIKEYASVSTQKIQEQIKEAQERLKSNETYLKNAEEEVREADRLKAEAIAGGAAAIGKSVGSTAIEKPTGKKSKVKTASTGSSGSSDTDISSTIIGGPDEKGLADRMREAADNYNFWVKERDDFKKAITEDRKKLQYFNIADSISRKAGVN